VRGAEVEVVEESGEVVSAELIRGATGSAAVHSRRSVLRSGGPPPEFSSALDGRARSP
jgi:hypothetical protein